MRKWKAIVFFGTIVLILAGYVAWCWRPFYVRPKISWDETISENDRRALAEWISEDDARGYYGGRPKWDWGLAKGFLKNPYTYSPSKMWFLNSESGYYLRSEGSGMTWWFYIQLEPSGPAADSGWVASDWPELEQEFQAVHLGNGQPPAERITTSTDAPGFTIEVE